MKKMFDTHAHYYDLKFNTLQGGARALLQSEDFKNSVGKIVNIGTNYQTSLLCINQAKIYSDMYVAVGIHPSDCQTCKLPIDEELARIYDLVKDKENRQKNKIVAIGEIGFDYYWEPVDKELQYEYFYKQMQMAEHLGLPVVIHNRESHNDMFDMLQKFPKVTGIIHSCSISHEMVRQLTSKGYYVSFSGTVSFKNAPRVKEACAAVPLDKLLIETDAPYLAPHPHRGKLNDSRLMIHTAQAIAQVHGLSLDEVVELTYDNGCRVYGILDN